jgi:predicted metalloendopeptidase
MLRMKLATDPHAPDKYRVIAPLANMPEFAEAFQQGRSVRHCVRVRNA